MGTVVVTSRLATKTERFQAARSAESTLHATNKNKQRLPGDGLFSGGQCTTAGSAVLTFA